MIGYDRLGSNGRFGNQLFQFCALRGIAAHHGYEWCIPPDNYPSTGNYGIHHPFKMKVKNVGWINNTVNHQAIYSYDNIKALNPMTHNLCEKSNVFDKEMFDTFPDGANLDGYMQTEKYFKHIRKELLEDLQFKDDILEPCQEFISQFEKIIFLHVRRGDYLKACYDGYHNVMSFDYYEKALAHFDDDTNVLVCSDDPEWCLEQDFFSNYRFLINTDIPTYEHEFREGDGEMVKSFVPYTDLCLMSLCNGAIICASSLGWWGAWLQANRTSPVVAPYNWFGDKSDNDMRDMFPEDWIVLNEK